jgi:hypothetical protein
MKWGSSPLAGLMRSSWSRAKLYRHFLMNGATNSGLSACPVQEELSNISPVLDSGPSVLHQIEILMPSWVGLSSG